MLRERQSHFLANPIRASYVTFPFSPPMPWLRHVPVSTTTFPFARSAYANSSSSEIMVVMDGMKVGSQSLKKGREQSQAEQV